VALTPGSMSVSVPPATTAADYGTSATVRIYVATDSPSFKMNLKNLLS